MAEEEIKDPQGLLKAYREAVEDLKTARDENKSLKEAAEQKPVEDNEWKSRAIKAEAKLALGGTGVKDVDRLMNYVSLDGIEFDDKGELTGLNERIEQVKKDLPELFDTKRRVGGKADIFADAAAESTPDPMREQIRQAIGA